MKIAIVSAAAVLAVAGAAVAIAKPAPNPVLPPAPEAGTGLPSGQCFRSQDIRNHTIGDRDTLLVAVNRNDVYRIGVKGCLAGAISSDPIITRSPPGSSIICKPLDLDISIAKGGFATHCIVDYVVKMTPEQVAALPKKLKP